MFVALPFLIFYASFSLLLGIYDARTGLLPDRLPVHYCGVVCFITRFACRSVYRMRFGVLSPAMADSR